MATTDYGSDGDSGKTIPSPSVSDFVVKQNSKIEDDKEPKKRLAESDASRDKSQVKKAKREKKKGTRADKSKTFDGGQGIWVAEEVNPKAPVLPVFSKGKTEVSVAPSATDNVLALPVPELEVSKKKVSSGSAKVASRARNRKVSRKMVFDGTDVEMKDYIIPMPAMEDNFMVKKGLELAEKSKVDALNEKWTKYQLELAQLYVKKLDLVMEHTKLRLDALKSNP